MKIEIWNKFNFTFGVKFNKLTPKKLNLINWGKYRYIKMIRCVHSCEKGGKKSLKH